MVLIMVLIEVFVSVTGCQAVVVIMTSRVEQTTQCSDGLVMGI